MNVKNVSGRDLSSAEIDQVSGGAAFIPIFWAGVKAGATVGGIAVSAYAVGKAAYAEFVAFVEDAFGGGGSY